MAALRHSARRVLKAAVFLFNLRTLLLCAAACASVAAAQAWGVAFNLEFGLIALTATLPLTFNITQSFARRERALVALAELKATAVALYWQHRDWVQDDAAFPFPESLGNDRHAWAMECAGVMLQFLSALTLYLQSTNDGYESLAEVRLAARRQSTLALLLADTRLHHDPSEQGLADSFITRVHHIATKLPGNRHLRDAYRALSRLSVMNEYLTFKSRYLRGGEGGMSRSAQYLRYLVAQLEQLRCLKLYRTPYMLRHCVSLLMTLSAIGLAPLWCHLGTCDTALEAAAFCPAPFVMAVIYAVIGQLLLNVQAAVEMPFDGSGLDDVFLELTQEFAEVASPDLGTLDDAPVGDPSSGACFAPARAAAAVAVAAAVEAAAAARESPLC